jgi:hypothetical protein
LIQINAPPLGRLRRRFRPVYLIRIKDRGAASDLL